MRRLREGDKIKLPDGRIVTVDSILEDNVVYTDPDSFIGVGMEQLALVELVSDDPSVPMPSELKDWYKKVMG